MSGFGDTEFEKQITGTINTNGGTLDITSSNATTTGIQLSGTWVGTLVLEGSLNGTTYTILSVMNLSTLVFANSMAANANFLANTASFNNSGAAFVTMRIRASAWTSGTVTINVYGTDASALPFTKTFLYGADGTQIGNTTDKLKVDANLTPTQLVPTITNKLRIRTNVGNVLLPAAGTFVTLYTRSGTGLFFGFQTAYNSDKVNIRLTIDGGQVFSLNLATIKDFQFNDTSTTRMQMGGFLSTVGNMLDFSSRYAIPYTTSVLLEAASSDGNNHNNTNWLVIQTEDT